MYDWLTSKSKSKLRYDLRSVGQSVLVSGRILGPRPDYCYHQTDAGLFMWAVLSHERPGLLLDLAKAVRFTTVKISSMSPYISSILTNLQTAFCIVSCQERCSTWTPTIYSSTCNSSIYVWMYNLYKAWHSRSCPNSCSSCYNGCLVTWTVVRSTVAKLKPFILCMSGFAYSDVVNTCISRSQWLRGLRHELSSFA
jgi:hypothetical protein